jgi:hypothetical protein
MFVRLSLRKALLKLLPQDRKHVTPALREFIEAEHAVVGQRHLPRPRHLTAADPPHSRNRLMGGATRPRGHRAGALATTCSSQAAQPEQVQDSSHSCLPLAAEATSDGPRVLPPSHAAVTISTAFHRWRP